MTLLAVKPDLPQPDIGSLLEALAEHHTVELDCATSPVDTDTIEVHTRWELEDRLAELFPFRPHMSPVKEPKRIGVEIVLVDGPPIGGTGQNLVEAIDDLLHNALDYIARWDRELRFGSDQQYWGWVYRLLIAGDEEHIKATLLNDDV